MRADDIAECAALGRDPADALRHGLRTSLWALTAIDTEPVAMLGVSPRSMLGGIGVPWMLGTERIYESGRALVALVPPVLVEMSSSFERLENIVGAGNVRAISFLRHFGFEVEEAQREISGLSFRRFHFERR